ncbi:M23 family metallopeptidase [Halalkalibacter nanhaiisediminis]|uniref:LysM domain-containing protein n=1 Tax=Halalkalibacter nanhaiisediminis TaxID=688079 RepID=A0A562QCZ4_9BACI|nr:M23 family metallopeptidase [Halalkalibacter nanhaiisediminis]TWI54621.1 LysM domain-containing protein [Halalkalibacter nanhaiisediminis]
MLDFVKRVCIALALAAFIGLLFLGTTTTLAAEKNLPNELYESLIWPTVGEVTDTYGTRSGKHYGIDLAAPEGTPVVSIADGTVSRSYYSDSYGHVVFVQHDNGLETVYAHLHQRLAEEGQVLEEGEQLGTVGNTGRSFGNHLHFEVHAGSWNLEKSEAVDPFLVLSNEPEYMYAALGEASPYGQDWRSREVTTVMSSKQEQATIKDSEKLRHDEVEMDNPSEESVEVVVQAGDTLWSIASHFQVSIDKLKEWNYLENDLLSVGSILTIYPSVADYVISEGDTLSAIAKEHEVTVELIMKENDLETDLIVPGQALSINELE